MDGRNDCAIVDTLEVMAHVMGQAHQALQNQNGMINEFIGLGKFQRNDPPTFKGRYDLEGAQVLLQEIEKIFRIMACSDA